jgi:hypothetical protein
VLARVLGYEHLFPCIILALYAGACARYLLARNYGSALYWFAAALITTAATWGREWRA